jgi:hypothetical protein
MLMHRNNASGFGTPSFEALSTFCGEVFSSNGFVSESLVVTSIFIVLRKEAKNYYNVNIQ